MSSSWIRHPSALPDSLSSPNLRSILMQWNSMRILALLPLLLLPHPLPLWIPHPPSTFRCSGPPLACPRVLIPLLPTLVSTLRTLILEMMHSTNMLPIRGSPRSCLVPLKLLPSPINYPMLSAYPPLSSSLLPRKRRPLDPLLARGFRPLRLTRHMGMPLLLPGNLLNLRLVLLPKMLVVLQRLSQDRQLL